MGRFRHHWPQARSPPPRHRRPGCAGVLRSVGTARGAPPGMWAGGGAARLAGAPGGAGVMVAKRPARYAVRPPQAQVTVAPSIPKLVVESVTWPVIEPPAVSMKSK